MTLIRLNPTKDYTDHRVTMIVNGTLARVSDFTLDLPTKRLSCSYDITGDVAGALITCELYAKAADGDVQVENRLQNLQITVSAALGGRAIEAANKNGSYRILPPGEYRLRIISDNAGSAGSVAIMVTAFH